MNILLLSTSDINGGAARAAYRLHQGLRGTGVRSHMLVQEKSSDDAAVKGPKTSLMQGVARSRLSLDGVPLKLFYRAWKRASPFSVQWLPERVAAQVAQMRPDVVNVHWTGSGFLQVKTLAKLRRPVVMTLHDMWAFTGGCHYSEGCDRYQQSCGACPILGSANAADLSRQIWRQKENHWRSLNAVAVSPSRWLADCARSSSLFRDRRVECIPNGLDTTVYQPIDRIWARRLLKLPGDKPLILFGAVKAASEPRKGFSLLQGALQSLRQAGWDDVELVILGSSPPETPPEIDFKIHYLGTLRDDVSLALAYAAADVFVLPSVQDNLPNVIMEAIACGTPCVGFDVGGIGDMIEHQRNGYLAQPFDVEDFAKGIVWILSDEERRQKLAHRAREKAEQEYTLERQAQRYQILFEQLLSSSES
jgi:glycosyltransferase involved in cell wall biosynthesis